MGWSKVSGKQRKELVVSEVTGMIYRCYNGLSKRMAVGWIMWKGIIGRNISMADQCKIPQGLVSLSEQH